MSTPDTAAQDLCAFVAASPSPYHAVAEAARRLEAAGFTPLEERDAWDLRPGAAHYVTRAGASLIAFRVGERSPVEAGFRLVGAHTDSPNLRLKPRPVSAREGYAQLAVEVYGGVLLHSWLDRDLGVAGRLVVEGEGGALETKLARLHGPVARVPSLAIHLDREVNDRGLLLNKQHHLAPLLGLGDAEAAREKLLARLADSCGVSASRVRGFDLGLYDLTAPVVGGLEGEFVFAARLDNLGSCHAAVSALVGAPSRSVTTRVVGLFDHEEVGSESAQGAAGSFLRDVLARLVEEMEGRVRAGLERAAAASFCVSADMAHAVHPNYAEKHEPRHMPVLGRGPVVKSNVQQRYATDGLTAARFRALCAEAKAPCQDFVTRTDLACGTTIGPIVSSRLGIATVDVGNPMLSMHSSREQCGAADVGAMVAALACHFA